MNSALLSCRCKGSTPTKLFRACSLLQFNAEFCLDSKRFATVDQKLLLLCFGTSIFSQEERLSARLWLKSCLNTDRLVLLLLLSLLLLFLADPVYAHLVRVRYRPLYTELGASPYWHRSTPLAPLSRSKCITSSHWWHIRRCVRLCHRHLPQTAYSRWLIHLSVPRGQFLRSLEPRQMPVLLEQETAARTGNAISLWW